MTVLILTAGSRGDVQPYVALGLGLVARDHSVSICTHRRFEAFVTDRDLGFEPLEDDLVDLIDTDAARGAMEDMGGWITGIRTGLALYRRSIGIQHDLMRDGWTAATRVQPDVLLYNPKMGGAVHFAEKLGVPVILAMLFPQMVPTADFPSLGFGALKLGGRYNRASYRLVHAIADRIGRGPIQAWRDAHGMRPHPAGLLHSADGTPIPVLHGISRHLVSVPTDWPPHAVNTGFWFLDAPETWTPPDDLTTFLDAGPLPVYVGFGSMSGRDPKRLARLVLEATQAAGVRAILATGWGGLAPGTLPGSVFRLDAAPHDWLFPRVAAVAHHGGAGTTAAGLRAGRPTVICPFFGDQPFWGERIHALGVGPEPIPQKKLTVAKLASALREATTDDAMRRRAGVLGELIRAEDGIAEAIAFIEYATAP